MPAKAFKTLNFSTRMEIIKSSLSVLKRALSQVAYVHVKRLIKDGTERDLVFTQGMTTGMQLAALDRKSTIAIIDVLKLGAARGKKESEGPLFTKAELEGIDSMLKAKFNLGTRRKILLTIQRSDGVLLDGLIEMLKKVA